MQAKFTIIRGKRRGTAFEICPNQAITLGRNATCGWILPDKKTSGYHCRLENNDGQWWLQDLGSRNGTYINGIRVQKASLAHHDIIRIGVSCFLFEIDMDNAIEQKADPQLSTLEGRAPAEFVSAQTRFGEPAMTARSPWFLGQMFGHYRLDKELGHGGMGVVYKAYDTTLQRTVALKVISSERYIDDDRIRRFVQEARATARLKHPNIVAIYEVGDHPQHYFTMEYLAGQTLGEKIRQERIVPRRAAMILQKVADALHTAHDAGIIHRDIKPSNIMLGADQEPKIMDFGLAKMIDQSLSCPGKLIGTPAYISPEQAEGRSVGPTSEVYALGATLYEVLTGRPPFEGETYFNILYQVLDNDPVPPRVLNPDIPVELDAICLKCLEKSPARRYANADNLAEDLANFIADRPVRARPATAFTHLRKFASRHCFWCSSAVLLLMLLFVVIFFHFYLEKRKLQDTQARLAESLLLQGDVLGMAGRWSEAHQSYRAASNLLRQTDNAPLPAELGIWDCYRQAPPPVNFFNGHSSRVHGVAFFPDGRRIVSGSADQTIKIWDIATGECLRTITGHSHRVLAVTISPDGVLIASASADHTIKIWQATDGRLVTTLSNHSGAVNCLQFSSDGRRLLSGSDDRTARIWDLRSGTQIQLFKGHKDTVSGVAFTPDQRYVFTSSWDKTIKMWQAATGKALRTFTGHKHVIRGLALAGDGKTLLSASWDRTARLWNADSGKEIRPLIGHKGRLYCIAISPDGRRVLTGSLDKTMRLWDVESGQELQIFRQDSNLYSIAFSADGTLAVCGGGNGSIYLWSVASEWEPRIFRGHDAPIGSVALALDGRLAATGSDDNTIRIWDIATGQTLQCIGGRQGRIHNLIFSDNGKQLIVGGANSIDIRDVATAARISHLPNEHIGQCNAFSRDKRLVAVGSPSGIITLSDLIRRRQLGRFTIATGADAQALAFSPDSSLLAAGSADHDIYIWHLENKKLLRILTGHTGSIQTLAFSPDGEMLLSGSWDRTLRLWDSERGKTIAIFRRHSDVVATATFSPDGLIALSGSWDGTLRLWDVKRGTELRAFNAHNRRVTSAVFGHAGQKVLSAGDDRLARLWDFSRANHYQKLENDLERAKKTLQSNNRHGPSLAIMGHWYAFRGIWSAALTCFSYAIRYGSEGIDSLPLAYCYWKNSQLAQAKQQFLLARQKHPQDRHYIQLCLQSLAKKPAAPASVAPTIVACQRKIANDYRVDSVALSSDGRLVLASCRDHSLKLWSVKDGRLVQTFRGHADAVLAVALSSDDRLAVSSGWDKTVRLWQVKTGQELCCWQGHNDDVESVAFSPNNRLVLSGSWDGTVRLWQIGKGSALRIFVGHTAAVVTVAFSPDGNHALSAGWDKTVRLWQVATGKQLRIFHGHTATIANVCFSPDGRQALSTSWDKSMKLWDIASSREIRCLVGHDGFVRHAIFGEYGRQIVSASSDCTLRLWETATGRQLMIFAGHEDAICGIDWSWRHGIIVSGSWDKTVAIWQIPDRKNNDKSP